MLLAIVFLIVGLVLLAGGAEAFVRGAATLALRFGLSPLVVGLTVVAFGTSAPELLVCVRAALDAQSDLAIGNAVGSNIFNTAAILGVAAIVNPVQVSTAVIRREVPIMIVVGAMLAFALYFGTPVDTLDRFEGIVLVLAFVAYVVYAYQIAKRERPESVIRYDAELQADAHVRKPDGTVWRDVLYLVAGGIALVIGARLLVDGAVTLARFMGVSELVIGLTIVAAGTGLPELATTVVAAFHKHSEMAVGNIVGSNIFNVLLVLGTTSAIVPLTAEHAVLVRDVPVMMLIFVICQPMMLTRYRIGRFEGVFLFLTYVAYVAFLVQGASR